MAEEPALGVAAALLAVLLVALVATPAWRLRPALWGLTGVVVPREQPWEWPDWPDGGCRQTEPSPPTRPSGLRVARDVTTLPHLPLPDPDYSPDLSYSYPYSYALDLPDQYGEGVAHMYSTVEIDPLLAGQLYAGPRQSGENRAWVYGNRMSHGTRYGMKEYSEGIPGQTGVDVGPLGLNQYSLDGKPDVYGDGLPERWGLPSIPVNWYKPQARDHYDVEKQNPTVYEPNLIGLSTPDHDPLFGG